MQMQLNRCPQAGHTLLVLALMAAALHMTLWSTRSLLLKPPTMGG